MSYAGLERAFCPACGIERADYEGPEKHLPSCPNCGSGEAPSRGALLECPLCGPEQGSVVLGQVVERFVFQPDGMAVEDDVPRELRLWCNTDPEHQFGTLPIDPTYGLPNMAEDVKAAVARAEGTGSWDTLLGHLYTRHGFTPDMLVDAEGQLPGLGALRIVHDVTHAGAAERVL